MGPPPSTLLPPDGLLTKPSPLAIPELLENIILHLPLRDVLLCQRVDTKFRDVVQDSSNIRKVLLLEPATSNTAELCSGFPSAFKNKRTKHVKKEHWRISENGETVQPLLNPFLVSLFETEDRPWKWAALDESRPPSFHHEMQLLMMLTGSDLDFHEARTAYTVYLSTFFAPRSSTKSLPPMLVTHPPSRSLAASERANTILDSRPYGYSRVGVRFDALFTAVTARMGASSTMSPPSGLKLAGASQWRVLPESALDRVTGWEMLAVLSEADPEDMKEEIDRIMEALKKWDHVVDENSKGGEDQKEAFAWELEDMEQNSPFKQVTVGSGPW